MHYTIFALILLCLTTGFSQGRNYIYDDGYYNNIELALNSPNKVTTLDLSYQGINSIDYRIGRFKNLKHLYLDGNKITTIPYQIGNLKNLEILDARNNNIKNWPYQVKKMKSLRFLRK